MTHSSRMTPYLIIAASLAAVLAMLGYPLGALLPFAIVLVCPLMMLVMMRGMSGTQRGDEDHTGHGCEHDPTRRVEPPSRTAQ
jgi:Protein of unknown function (DUF2933)